MNCILIDDDEMSRRVVEEYAAKVEFLNLTHSFANAVDALNYLKNTHDSIHLVLLDVEMPEMTGIDFLEINQDNNPQVIIVSSKEKYALKAIEHSVVDYLLKPITFPRFIKAVSKAYQRFNVQRSPLDEEKEVFIKRSNSLIRIRCSDITWVEALENYIVINTVADRFTIHLTMKSIENQLPAVRFKRVHRSFIVNLGRIDSIEDNSIAIRVNEGKKLIPIGKSYRDNLLRDINLINK